MAHGITLHDTITEEEIGTVILANDKDTYADFTDEVHRTWELYHEKEEVFISEFMKFHNENSDVKITYLEIEFIQL